MGHWLGGGLGARPKIAGCVCSSRPLEGARSPLGPLGDPPLPPHDRAHQRVQSLGFRLGSSLILRLSRQETDTEKGVDAGTSFIRVSCGPVGDGWVESRSAGQRRCQS